MSGRLNLSNPLENLLQCEHNWGNAKADDDVVYLYVYVDRAGSWSFIIYVESN